ncbi:MAG: response regulator, partial [bacterium]
MDKGSTLQFDGAKRRILVVEDELVNRELLGFMLQDCYDLTFAETGGEALALLSEQAEMPSLVLLDLNLPDMHGVEILRRCKENALTTILPFIVMTADQEAEVECLNLGATDFISKPYPKREVILARILRTIELFEGRDIIRWTERDQLTGLYNREFFYRYVAQFEARHPNVPTDAIYLNINRFHMFNERHGKATGDNALRLLAHALQKTIHEAGGFVCRREADAFL